MTETKTVRVERNDGVVTISLSRPERHNAQTPGMWSDLRVIGEQLADEDVRCLVVRGDGKSFSSGLDLAETGSTGAVGMDAVASLGEDRVAANIERAQGAFRWIAEASFPSVAAVHGHALGAGMQLALACDLRIAAVGAVFAQPELDIGVIPDMGAAVWLPRLVGPSVALDLVLTGRRISAEEALSLGLVNQVVELDALASTVDDLARALAARPPVAVRHAKASLAAGLLDRDAGFRLSAAGSAACLRTDEYAEAVKARMERRSPRYRGS